MAAMLLVPALAFAAPFAGIVMDARTGKVLWEQNADARLHPASLTKMLTLYIAFDAIRRGEVSENDMVTVSANAARQPPSRLGLRAGQKISLRHLIRAAAIKSANDAAAAIGDHLAGSPEAFSRRMNRTAKALGMSRSSFRNAHGLTADGHLSTARDMNLLGRRLFYDFPEFYGLFSRITEDAGVAKVSNTNRRFLETYRGADGIKTGYTNPAGFNLTASAERGGKRLVATVFGGTSTAQRNQRIGELLDYGFGNAPAVVRSTPPKPVQLDEVAGLDAPASATPGGAGKTLRVQTALANSPRPAARPAALSATAVAEVTSGVADVLAGLSAPEPEPPPFQTASAETPLAPPGVTQSVTEAVAQIAEATEATLLLTTQPRARPAHLAGLAAAEDSPAAPPAETQLATARPESRPETLAEAPMEAAPLASFAALTPAPEAPAAPTLADAASAVASLPFQVIGADGSTPNVSLADLADPDLPDELPSPSAEDGEELPGNTRLAGALVVPETLSPSPRPKARPGEIVMTVASAEGETLPTNLQRTASTGEVVSRVSTSGGRHWAVTLGKFNTRGGAERLLLQTALSETRALEGALRKVTSRGSGYEATFAGLTRDQADLVCRRLQARAISCFTLGP